MSLIKSVELRKKRANNAKIMEDQVRSGLDAGTPVTKEQFDKYEADQAALLEEIRQAEFLEKQAAAQAKDAAQRQENTGEGADEQQDKEKRFGDAFIKYICRGANKMTSEEMEILKRGTDPQTTTDAEGGFMIPTGFSNQLFVEKALWGGMFDVAHVVNTATGNDLPWPKVDDTGETGELVAEAGAVSIKDIAFTAMTLNAWMYSSGIVKASEQLLQDTAFPLQDILIPMFGRRLGTIQNLHFTTGDASSKPNGFITAASSGVTAAATGAVTRTELNSLKYSVNAAWRQGRSVGYMMNDATVSAISALSMGTAASDNGPLWMPGTAAGSPDMINGYPVFVNQNMANMAASSTSIAFGDFYQYKIRVAGGPTVKRLDELYAANLLKGFLAFERIDGDLLGTNAIKYITQAAS